MNTEITVFDIMAVCGFVYSIIAIVLGAICLYKQNERR